jgi:hypothetical protein
MRFRTRLLGLWLVMLAACTVAVGLPRLQHPTPYERTALFHSDVCTLPCWIGIVPGQTTIGEARTLILREFDREYAVRMVGTSDDYRTGFVIVMQVKDSSRYWRVELNNWQRDGQDDTTPVHKIEIALRGDVTYTPTLLDMMLILRNPACLGTERIDSAYFETTMLYPQYQTRLRFRGRDYDVSPDLTTVIIIEDQPLACGEWFTLPWHGFGRDYRKALFDIVHDQVM